MADNETKTDWPGWIKERLASPDQKLNLKHGKIAWCYAFYRGDQYKVLDESNGNVREVNVKRETRCLYNICKPFADAFTAKMLKGDPVPSTTPYSTNTETYDEDVNVATNGAVEYWWKSVVDGPAKLKHAIRWGAIGGIGFAKVYYDKNAKSGIYQGEVVWEKINPLHVFANADAQNDEEFREVIHRFPKEKSVVEEEFAEKLKELGITELEAEQKNDANAERSEMSKLVDENHLGEVKATVLVNDIWIKASNKYPQGKHVIVVGQHVLVDEDNPEPDTVPFFSYAMNPLLDDLYGQGIIYPIIRIQRDMNKLNSVVQENASTMGNLKWLVHENANVLPGAFDDAAGEIVNWAGQVEPRQSSANPLPEHLTNRFWDLFRMAQFISRLQDVGLGMVPYRGSQIAPGVTSQLQDSEDVMFAPDIRDVVAFVQKIVRRYLYLVKKYYDEARVVTVVGENKRPEAISFLSEKIADDYNVSIRVGNGFSKSDENKAAAVQSLMQTGAFEKSGINLRLVMEQTLKWMGLDKIREDTFRDERQAQRNLDRIKRGESPVISKFINPVPHIEVFTNFCKTAEWEALPLQVQVGIDQYIDRMVGMIPPPPAGPNGQPPPIGAPGNMPPQMPSPQEAAAADANERMATGQPVMNNGQTAQEAVPAGV